ncbi:antibiotic biosynthesis monooxygenase [Arthrobacter sp. NEB 688]|uniref:antibiotic biosynthesis monooxygenase family protein n=1 Tax=Arthrobacter sp. NEB 688 TaxID=904039 RepID=UPI001566FC72|nr:antibiotic biosynthesis monooxygenase [Arthrobacter sp. NEB 688]QKE85728.1 antibiotic biosynthesis monooxygenase [Arthrobacter sp. NEB 688]
MICCQFVFAPGGYDEEFHRLDQEIDAYARALPGFVSAQTWTAPERGLVNAIYYFTDTASVRELARFPAHREAKDHVHRWYQGYQVVISNVTATYGDDRLTTHP